MKIIIILVGLFSFSLNSFSQKSKTRKWISDFSGFELQYSLFQPKINNLNTYFNTRYSNSIKNIAFVGFNIKSSDMVESANFNYDWNIDFNYVLPTDYKSPLNSDFYNFKGYQWGSMVHGNDLLYKVKRLDLILGIGYNAGKYTVTENYMNENIKYYNRFFALKMTTELRCILNNFSLGARAEYQWDNTSGVWKTSALESLPYTRFTGLNIHFFIGYGKLKKVNSSRK